MQERWVYLHVKRYHVHVKVAVAVDLESVELVDLNLPALMDSLPYHFVLMAGDQGELFVKTPEINRE